MKLTIAIQRSGRLAEESLRLLKESGIGISNGLSKLKSEATNFPAEIYYLRDDDIPQYVEDGIADVGIVGENVFLEKKKEAALVSRLGFGKCRLSIAVAKDKLINGVHDLENMRIATCYPNVLSAYLKANSLIAEIHQISGSVEIAPSIGLADAICDLVSSGSTLFTNGLKEVEVILHSEAVLIKNTTLSQGKEEILQKLLLRFNAVQRAKDNKYILLNAPNDRLEMICNLLPGMKSPTVVPLAESGWSSVHSVINENDFWQMIEQLKNLGAQGILVVAIEKMIL
ncbi:MAG: ATP phosphoribosyltransferase [Candidatus Kapaibacterium sp.]|jgi:ATP phosphoribosyltransferase